MTDFERICDRAFRKAKRIVRRENKVVPAECDNPSWEAFLAAAKRVEGRFTALVQVHGFHKMYRELTICAKLELKKSLLACMVVNAYPGAQSS